MNRKPTLTLSFDPDNGSPPLRICLPLEEHIASDIERIEPPSRSPVAFLSNSIDAVVHVLRSKVFRKDMFISEARRLGALLAERMEDAEGWHDESRVEPA